MMLNNKTVSLGVLDRQDLEKAVLPFMLGRYGEAFDVGLFHSAAEYITELFDGQIPGFLVIDLPYHDLKHTLDTTLAAARLVDGYETFLASRGSPPFGPDKALLTLLCALFHDCGFIRSESERDIQGSTLMPVHVARGEIHFRNWFSGRLDGERVEAASAIHYTDHLKTVAEIEHGVPEHWRVTGRILGTADLMSQMADRFYLERCRDALFAEFSGAGNAMFASAQDLLQRTPAFINHVRDQRLTVELQATYRHFERHFGTSCPYMAAIDRNLVYLETMIARPHQNLLRRDIAKRLQTLR